MILQALLQSFFGLLFLILILALCIIIGIRIYRNKQNRGLRAKDAKRIILAWENIQESNDTRSFPDKSLLLSDIKRGLDKLIKQDNITEVVLDMDHMDLNNVHVEELKPFFEKLNQTKKVIAYASELNNSNYRAALLAKTIYLMDSMDATFSLTGYYHAVPYFKKLLDTFGVKMEVVHIGDYKSAGENLYLDAMSKQNREAQTALYDSMFDTLCENILQLRSIDVKDSILKGELSLINAKHAVALGLIDGTSNQEELHLDDEDETIDWKSFLSGVKHKKNKVKDKIAVITINGTISDKDDDVNLDSLLEKLDCLKEDEGIKGLVLRIDSPGGDAIESEKIYRKLKKLTLPVYVSMGDVCASGGYLISCAAKKIFANKSTITGSIGVVMLYPIIEGALSKVDVAKSVIIRGEGHDMANPYESLGDSSRAKLLKHLSAVYEEFKGHVKEARNIPDEKLEPIAGGRVWSGIQAFENGLIDQIGTLEDCAKSLAEECQLESYEIVHIQGKKKLPTLKTLVSQGIHTRLLMHLDFINKHQNRVMLYEDMHTLR